MPRFPTHWKPFVSGARKPLAEVVSPQEEDSQADDSRVTESSSSDTFESLVVCPTQPKISVAVGSLVDAGDAVSNLSFVTAFALSTFPEHVEWHL